MIARDGMQRPTEGRLQALRDYYKGNVGGAGDVEDLFREIDALTAQIEKLDAAYTRELAALKAEERERDEWRSLFKVEKHDREAAEQRVKELEAALKPLLKWVALLERNNEGRANDEYFEIRMSDINNVIVRAEPVRAALAQSDPPED